MLAVHPDLISYQTQTLLDMIYQENWVKDAVQMLHLYLQIQYNLSHLSSISVLSSSYAVNLMVEEQYCFQMGSSTQRGTAAATSTSSPTVVGPGGEDSKGINGK